MNKSELTEEKLDSVVGGSGLYQDIVLICKDCGREYIYSAAEQERNCEKGFQNQPDRCKKCREERKAQKQGRITYSTTCSLCGIAITVPFEPKEGRPTYCDSCFKKIRAQYD